MRGRCRVVGIRIVDIHVVGVVVVTVTIILIVIVTMHLIVDIITEISARVMRVIISITLQPMRFVVSVSTMVITTISVTLVVRLANHLDVLPCIIISWKFSREYVTVWSIVGCCAPIPRLVFFKHNIA